MSDPFDFYDFDTAPRSPMPMHTITVLQAVYDEPADEFGIDPTKVEWEIDHGSCEVRGEECIVEGTVDELGLHQAFFGVFDKDHRLEVKTYRVRGWVSVSPATPNGPEEYDAGIEEVDDDS